MKKLFLTVAWTALLTNLAAAQPGADPRVADLVQAGKIRVGVHSCDVPKGSTRRVR